MDIIIWIIVLGPFIVAITFMCGWLAEFNASSRLTNWGTGFDNGWEAHKEFMGIMNEEERNNNE